MIKFLKSKQELLIIEIITNFEIALKSDSKRIMTLVCHQCFTN